MFHALTNDFVSTEPDHPPIRSLTHLLSHAPRVDVRLGERGSRPCALARVGPPALLLLRVGDEWVCATESRLDEGPYTTQQYAAGGHQSHSEHDEHGDLIAEKRDEELLRRCRSQQGRRHEARRRRCGSGGCRDHVIVRLLRRRRVLHVNVFLSGGTESNFENRLDGAERDLSERFG